MLVHLLIAGDVPGQELTDATENVVNLEHVVRAFPQHGKEAWWLYLELTENATTSANGGFLLAYLAKSGESDVLPKRRLNELTRLGSDRVLFHPDRD